MSYDEFWLKDYKLVESYKKRHDMDIERETMCNWELAQYIRGAIQEVATRVFKAKGKGKVFDFPNAPEPRTQRAKYLKEREEKLNAHIKRYMEERKQKREGKSDA